MFAELSFKVLKALSKVYNSVKQILCALIAF